jgi:hypothetical protein
MVPSIAAGATFRPAHDVSPPLPIRIEQISAFHVELTGNQPFKSILIICALKQASLTGTPANYRSQAGPRSQTGGDGWMESRGYWGIIV